MICPRCGADLSAADGATRLRPQRPAPAQTAASLRPQQASAQSKSEPLAPGQVFRSRYHIIRALGVGRMGAVYQAWDAELGVAVAIKVIRPDVMDDPGVAEERRFKRELPLAREVTHPNVVRIHDLGEIDGIKYITMTYVDGSDLSSLLEREGTLLVPTVLRIARAVVAGLVAAHMAGVVHRDLKPANIIIAESGEALIADQRVQQGSGSLFFCVTPLSLKRPAACYDSERFFQAFQ